MDTKRVFPGSDAGCSRRRALELMGGAAALSPFATLLACSDSTDVMSDAALGDAAVVGGESGALVDSGALATTDADLLSDGAATVGDAASAADAARVGGWATGGTASMTGIASYPNPFDAVVDATCTPTCAMTLGPCHDDMAPMREDISEGQPGLPMRFGLRILDSNCQPVTDANVDIWHCDTVGVYSSDTADNPPFCTGSNAEALAARWFRGHQMTNSDGIAWFNSCFPGWYSGRAIHIHLTVRRSSREGQEYLTSQVAFPPSLIQEICSTHVDYSGHGQPDTANTADSVFPSATVDEYEVSYDQMADGAMLAWKTIVIRSALTETVCSAGGSSGRPPSP